MKHKIVSIILILLYFSQSYGNELCLSPKSQTKENNFYASDENGYTKYQDFIGYLHPETEMKFSEVYTSSVLPLINEPKITDLYPSKFSLVKIINKENFMNSENYQKLITRLKNTSFWGKLFFNNENLRHFTFLEITELVNKGLTLEDITNRLRHIAPFKIEVRGLWPFNFVKERGWFKIFPQINSNSNPIENILNIFSAKNWGTYPMAIFQFKEELSSEEVLIYNRIIKEFESTLFFTLNVSSIDLVIHNNNLLLNGKVNNISFGLSQKETLYAA